MKCVTTTLQKTANWVLWSCYDLLRTIALNIPFFTHLLSVHTKQLPQKDVSLYPCSLLSRSQLETGLTYSSCQISSFRTRQHLLEAMGINKPIGYFVPYLSTLALLPLQGPLTNPHCLFSEEIGYHSKTHLLQTWAEFQQHIFTWNMSFVSEFSIWGIVDILVTVNECLGVVTPEKMPLWREHHLLLSNIPPLLAGQSICQAWMTHETLGSILRDTKINK